MGMFDSYFIPWGDDEAEIQTKEFDSTLARWYLGDRVLIEPAFSDASGVCILLEDFSLNSQYRYVPAQRHVALLHFNGIFADYCCGLSFEEVQATQTRLEKIWLNPFWRSLGFAKLLDIERNRSHAREQFGARLSQLNQDWLNWKQRDLTKNQRSKGLFFPLTDFDATSYDDRLKEALSHSPSLDSAQLSCPEPLCRAFPDPELTSSTDDPILSAAPDDFHFKTQPARLQWKDHWKTSQEALLDLCSTAQILQAALLVNQYPELLNDPSSQRVIDELLSDAFCSRLFVADAVDFCLHTHYFPVSIGPSRTFQNSMATWLITRLGLQTGTLKNLMNAGMPIPTLELAPYLTIPTYIPCLPLFSETLPPDARVEFYQTLLDASVQTASVRLMESALHSGAQPNANMLQILAAEAARTYTPDFPSAQGPIACASLLIHHGVGTHLIDPAHRIEPLERAFAQYEQLQLTDETPRSRGNRKRKLKI